MKRKKVITILHKTLALV